MADELAVWQSRFADLIAPVAHHDVWAEIGYRRR